MEKVTTESAKETAKDTFAKATKYATMVGAPLLIVGSIYQLTKAKGKGTFNGYVMPLIGLFTGITAFNAVYNLKTKSEVVEAVIEEQVEPLPENEAKK